MKILVANHSLKQAGGTETFTYTLISELKKQNYDVEYFCFEKGEFSDRIEHDLNISFKSFNKYDLILANHKTTVEELHQKGLTIQTCHGIFPALEQPSKYADGHVAISQEVHNHIFSKGFRSIIIYNGIDCERYKPLQPLSQRNPKVLSLCHSEEAHEIIKLACESLDLKFSILDKYKDKAWFVESIINNHDIVIGLGRSAYEALACGRPVIIFDKRNYSEGFGDGYFINSMVESIKNNCSGRALKIDFTKENIIKELLRYHPEHGIIARNYALQSFNIKKTTEEYIKFANWILQDKENNKIQNKLKNLVRELILLIPERIKSPIRSLDSKIGNPILRLKRII